MYTRHSAILESTPRHLPPTCYLLPITHLATYPERAIYTSVCYSHISDQYTLHLIKLYLSNFYCHCQLVFGGNNDQLEWTLSTLRYTARQSMFL